MNVKDERGNDPIQDWLESAPPEVLELFVPGSGDPKAWAQATAKAICLDLEQVLLRRITGIHTGKIPANGLQQLDEG